MIKEFKSKEFLKFLLVGGVAAVANFLSRILFSFYTNLIISITFAYLTGMIIAYCLNKFFVFKESAQPLRNSISFFILVNLVAIAQTFFITLGFKFYILPMFDLKWHVNEIAHAIGVCFPVFTSYLGHKYLSFRTN